MDLLSIAFLVLHVLIIGLSVFIGYRRALGRSLVRLVYLMAIGVVAFFLGRFLAFQFSDVAMGIVHSMLPADLQNALNQTPELEPLLANIAGALAAPILFALIFGLLQLLTLLFFKKISRAIVVAISKKEESSTWTKWMGAASGLVIGVAVTAVLLSPMYVILNVSESISDNTSQHLSEAYDEYGMPTLPSNAMSVQPMALKLQIKPSMKITSFFPWEKPLINILTTYHLHESIEKEHHESLLHALPVLIEASGDALYSYNVTIKNGGDATDALSNAAASVIPHLGESDTIKYLSADVLHSLGKTLQNGDSFFGISLPETDNALANSLITNLVDALADTTPETAEANMITLFGKPTISPDDENPEISTNSGLLSTMTKVDSQDPLSSLRGSNTLELVGSLAENDNMSAMLNDIQNFTTELIQEKGIDLADQQYESFYNNVKEDISSHIANHVGNEESTITDVAKDIESTIGGYLEEHEIEMDDMEVSVVSVSIAKEFLGEQYLQDGQVDISIKDLMDFFGVDESQIPDWAH